MLILRSPPFPDLDPAVASVSVRRDPDSHPTVREAIAEGRRSEALGRLLVERRVGGAFWARQLDLPRRYGLWIHGESPRRAVSRAAAALQAFDASAVFVSLRQVADAGAAARSLTAKGIECAIGELDPWPMLARVDRLEVDGRGELAFLARLSGVAVQLAGGTDEGLTAADASAADLLINTVAYRSPFTGQPIEAEEAVEILSDWRRQIDANRGIAAGAGVARWKREQVARMCWSGTRHLPPMSRGWQRPLARAARGKATLVAWPSRVPPVLARVAAERDVAVARVEDGFVRSIGLGSDCYPPFSVVVDLRGIYYDAGAPSDLEWLLAYATFSPALLQRADALAARLVAGGVTKYAVGRAPIAFENETRRKVLVVGQVEDDLSVMTSGGDVQGNLDLLRRVRAERPDGFVVFRPHPDVVVGHRKGHVEERIALHLADRVDLGSSMPGLIDAVDEVHVLTSLAGFEALLRGKAVVAHGCPFYAGWGLTEDRGPAMLRRTRRLDLSQLVAATLILYPRYLDPLTNLPCSPEVLLDRLTGGYGPPETLATHFRRVLSRLKVGLGPAK